MIIVISLSIRLLPALIFPFASGYDISSFWQAGEKIVRREDIYQDLTFRYHYSFLPTYAFICALLIEFASRINISVIILMKLFIIVFDSLIAVLIYKSGSCRSRVPSFASKSLHFVGLKASEATLGSPSLASPAISTLIYALSPIPVLLGSFFGQFDAIPLFFLLLGIFLASKKRFSWGLFSLGLGTCFKPWVFLFVPMVLWREKNWADRGKLLTFYFLPLFIITLLYILLIPSGDIINMLKGIGLYISVAGWWGPSVFFGKLAELFAIPRLLTIPSQISKVVTVGLIFYLAIKLKNKNIYQAAKLTILAIYIFSFGFAIQYLVWILPFLLITRDKRLKYYLIFVGLYYLIFGTTRILNYNFQPPQIPEIFYYSASFFLWLFFVKWGIKEKRSVELR